MKKIAISFTIDEYDDVKSIAQHLQRFIVEDDYRSSSIAKKIIASERIVLDVGMEDNMPDFEELAKEFDEDEVVYELYKPVNSGWEKCELNDLELSRVPEWVNMVVGLNIIWYSVMTFLQIFYIYDWYSQKYEWSGIVSTVGSLIATLIPIYGSLVSYWSATELSDWGNYEALFAFFGYYLPLLLFILWLIFYLAWVFAKALWGDRWYRFWYSEFN